MSEEDKELIPADDQFDASSNDVAEENSHSSYKVPGGDKPDFKYQLTGMYQSWFLDYASYVILERAVPHLEDGLKPVQRRNLYDMHELGIRSDRPYRKCARIVGDTMGKYHPHGDSSIYEALVVMSQDFKKGLPLIDGHGNFGSIEGDGAAAMRYTEARLPKFTEREKQ